MDKLNVAVVGAGIYGINHVNAYLSNSNVNLAAAEKENVRVAV